MYLAKEKTIKLLIIYPLGWSTLPHITMNSISKEEGKRMVLGMTDNFCHISFVLGIVSCFTCISM